MIESANIQGNLELKLERDRKNEFKRQNNNLNDKISQLEGQIRAQNKILEDLKKQIDEAMQANREIRTKCDQEKKDLFRQLQTLILAIIQAKNTDKVKYFQQQQELINTKAELDFVKKTGYTREQNIQIEQYQNQRKDMENQ
ncbi:hypothetical protein HPP_0380 [Hydrangea phyllody phytoplasma]|uniref:Uncharacterized protein n=2 Tax=16SrI (Aster yellows group) TaxID=3042590 RepID=A0ABQ5PRT8_9MOLU|nr:hypothetical protein [Hydrangea phyllody phytoplasma]GFZ75080.1 hypothetical protein HPP_0380 [Hydrangea phyllody phytoplasma]GLH61078.1 hypothetical protein RHYP_0230 [Rhus yellows phytoplasma]GLH61960.1 hypothetical protein HP2P_3670 [Hydrangea phyllody phytoplasma]